jgi:hypothetical protein
MRAVVKAVAATSGNCALSDRTVRAPTGVHTGWKRDKAQEAEVWGTWNWSEPT